MAKKKKLKSKEKHLEIRVVADKKTFDNNRKEFHVNQRLSHYPEEYFGIADASEFNVRDQQNESYVLAEYLFKVNGVQDVEIDGYIVRISLSKAFRWGEVEKAIIDCIKKYAYAVRLELRAHSKDSNT